MRILYVTDLHGRQEGYETVLERARAAGVRAILNGGDLYPLGPELFRVQRSFLQGYLPDYLRRCRESGIAWIATAGNMDLRGLDRSLRELAAGLEEAFVLLGERVEFAGWSFIGTPMTVDGPFSLKDRCLRDTGHWQGPPQQAKALLSDEEGLHGAQDWPRLLAERPTLEHHLAELPRPEDPARTVYLIHQPPHGVGQGLICPGTDVGSEAVRRFLEDSGAGLSLHGHIHESPFVSGGRWSARLGQTITIQPGQLSGGQCVTVLIDLEHPDRAERRLS